MIRDSTALVALIVALLVGLTSCSSEQAQEPASATPARLADLNEMDDLRAAFNAEPGVPRLVLLLSPT